MTSLQSSIAMKNRSAKGPSSVAGNGAGVGSTNVSNGSGGIKKSLSKKNAGIVPSPGVEKTNSAS
jgi:hypothetical protein